MNLDKITTNECPDCKSKVKKKSSYDQHSSGEWRELVEFKCGATLEYDTNFKRIQKKYACPNGPELRKEIKEHKENLKKIVNFINDTFGEKEMISQYCEHISIDDCDIEEIRDLAARKLSDTKKQLMAKFVI